MKAYKSILVNWGDNFAWDLVGVSGAASGSHLSFKGKKTHPPSAAAGLCMWWYASCHKLDARLVDRWSMFEDGG